MGVELQTALGGIGGVGSGGEGSLRMASAYFLVEFGVGYRVHGGLDEADERSDGSKYELAFSWQLVPDFGETSSRFEVD